MTLYDETPARYYDMLFTGLEGDVEFYVEEAQRSGSPVLELGCGTGRIVIPTAEAGIEVTGLDVSPFMLDAASRKVEKLETQSIVQESLFEELDGEGNVIRRTEDTCPFRWIYRYEMEHLLARCGFEVEALYGDFNRGPHRYGGEQIWVARKAE